MTEVIEPTEAQHEHEELRWLTDVYMQVQKLRVANNNRVQAAKTGMDDNYPDPFVASLVERLEELEHDMYRQMGKAMKEHPTWHWLAQVKGIGPTLGTKIVGLIGDISKFDTISKLWSFAGYGLKDGKAQRPQKGQKLPYNRRLKTALYLAGDSFIKSRSPFRKIYDTSKQRYRIKKQVYPMVEILGADPDDLPDRTTPAGKKEWDKLIKECNKAAGAEKDEACWTDLHVENAARRHMVKIFLACLYKVWREAEGLPVRQPIILERPDLDPTGVLHTTEHDPWEFVS